MKRFFLMWGLVIALLLSGCGSSASRVETLKSWSFQYNEGTSDYSLFFGLADKNDKSLSADVDVDIRIVNDADEESLPLRSKPENPQAGRFISPCTRKTQFSLTK